MGSLRKNEEEFYGIYRGRENLATRKGWFIFGVEVAGCGFL
jgi:hypothetical protein